MIDNSLLNRVLALSAGLIGGASFFVGSAAWAISSFGANPFFVIGAAVIAVPVGFALHWGTASFIKIFDQKVERKKEVVDLQEKIDQMGEISGITKQAFIQTLSDASDLLKAIRDASLRLTSNSQRMKLIDLSKLGNEILAEISKDPKDYRIARSWLNSHLKETASLVDKFTKLENRSPKIVEEFESTIDQLTLNYQNLLTQLRSNNDDELIVTMSVLKELTK